MKIKAVPVGSNIECNGAKAVVLSHGVMGTRVSVLEITEYNGFVLGFQIWSEESEVMPTHRINAEGSKSPKFETLPSSKAT